MSNQRIIKAFKMRSRQIALKRKDPRFTKTIAVLKAKGLLETNLPIVPLPRLRLDINDVIWAGKNVEPRIIEVLPAAILHFPKNFVGLNDAPEEIREIIKRIKDGEEDGLDFAGIEYKKMKYWASMILKDKRTRPTNQKRRSKMFRLRPESLMKLNQLVESKRFRNQTEAIEAAIAGL